MIKKIFKKKNKGMIGLVFSLFMIFFILTVIIMTLQQRVDVNISKHIEDSLSMSVLACNLQDIKLYSLTRNSVINNPDENYRQFKDVLATNLFSSAFTGNKATKTDFYIRADGENGRYIQIYDYLVFNAHNIAYGESSDFMDVDVYSYGDHIYDVSSLRNLAPGCDIEVSDKSKMSGYVGTIKGCRYNYASLDTYSSYGSSGVGILDYAKTLKGNSSEVESYKTYMGLIKGLMAPNGVPIVATGIYSSIKLPVKMSNVEFFDEPEDSYVIAYKEQLSMTIADNRAIFEYRVR